MTSVALICLSDAQSEVPIMAGTAWSSIYIGVSDIINRLDDIS